ncbi:uncharacterized protein I303_107112 [Kwoniella dejecticola CBS 10117]|uniref:Catalase core domain-containing protein n=1 Tax=Kwoniella dejecticola CBS 10117 TaxID=1296121 RepID=A0A1A5ZYR8_9TREE|nr:uncharacterized protein I303_06514 [Kwoniella dejecticola CBS 10117]OBR82956.1 hypothetical protein I303_06514 [Kwoniella dejecticola CBS 10117]
MQAVSDTVKSAVETFVGPTQVAGPDEWLKADESEQREDDEDAKILRVGELVHDMQRHNFDAHQHKFRGTHVKSLGFVKGSITINPDLPPYLAHGLFANGGEGQGKTYDCIGRYANEPSFILPDTTSAPRGFSLKIFGVQGERLSPSPDGSTDQGTQDFLFNNAPIVELTDLNTTIEIFELRTRYFDNPTRLNLELAKRSDRLKQFAPTMLPNEYVVGSTFYSQSAFKFGPYACKFSLLPISKFQEEFKGQTIPKDASPTFHRDHIRSYYSTNPTEYKLRAQFASDLSKQPVEDASVEWNESYAPWYDLATLKFPAQETFSDERRVWWEDRIGLSPWDGLKDHRPLGSINRLRHKAYEMSRAYREKGNQAKVYLPLKVDDMPN